MVSGRGNGHTPAGLPVAEQPVVGGVGGDGPRMSRFGAPSVIRTMYSSRHGGAPPASGFAEAPTDAWMSGSVCCGPPGSVQKKYCASVNIPASGVAP